MKALLAAPPLAAIALSACATPQGSTDGTSTGSAEGQCDAAPAQKLVGTKATGEVGTQLLRLTGARQLRWAPPNSALTMDYRADRLTVSYDDEMVIDRISCG
ncbi:peptidase inhibitor I78 family protein [Altererythrobacter sp. B11]|uniref:I78 family peptidase inhibitor n=1 Tax=Altererythrobacter sp. B11 TaxID=2060312 RepID=UPI000DC6D78F|nr:I78 family peptidase inhibitor [Altererythrobacter sp. B11]BBC72043.1 peptidase inhibitor I78 family protein [Altererythrobacter sp. B11]